MSWLDDYDSEYGDQIRKHRMHTPRVMELTGLSEYHAQALGSYCRTVKAKLDSWEQNPPSGLPEPEPVKRSSAEIIFRHDYAYNQTDDVYVFRCPPAPDGQWVVDGAEYRAIVARYPTATQVELAQEFGVPEDWLKAAFKAEHRTKDREPFTQEQINSHSVEQLTEMADVQRRGEVKLALKRSQWRAVKRQAARGERLEHIAEEILGRCVERLGRAPERVYRPLPTLTTSFPPYLLVVGMQDVHFGERAGWMESNKPYNKSISSDRLMRCTTNLIRQSARFGKPDEILVPVAPDFFHVANMAKATTAGTVQSLDGSVFSMVDQGVDLFVEAMNLLRSAKQRKLVLQLVPGNHETLLSLCLMKVLQYHFAWCDDVCVEIPNYMPSQYYEYGENMIRSEHGDGPKAIAQTMAAEEPGMWGRTRRRVSITGHLHHFHMREIDGVLAYQVRSLSGATDWAVKKGFNRATAGMDGIMLWEEASLHGYGPYLPACATGEP